MILGCFGAYTALAQSDKGPGSAGTKPSKKEKKKEGEKKIDTGYGLSQNLVNVGPTITPEEAVSKLVKGKTTLDEVLLLLGPPMHLNMYGEGGRMATYLWQKNLQMGKPNSGKAMGEGAFPLITLFKGGKRFDAAQQAMEEVRNSIKTLTAIFDSSGVLKDFVMNPPIMPLPQKPAAPSAPTVVTLPQKVGKVETSDAPLIAATPASR
jgi:outer membrane protein assembly factor BamE (lipoprotein component of BamABCDE complex)